jgi:hypothetical protein
LIEAAIEPIERMELLIASAQQNFHDLDIEPKAAQHLAVAIDMLEAETASLRRVLYGDDLGP